MGSDIVSQTREIALLLSKLREKADAGKADELVSTATALQRDLRLLTRHGKALGSSKVADQVRARKALNTIELAAEDGTARALEAPSIAIDPEPRDSMEIESFFDQVTGSMVKTQERLNAASLDYVSQLDPRIAPAYFTIPSLKAELKVGFNTTGGNRLNLILFSREREKKAYGESTVTFELVAAPPPPGETPFGALNLPTPRFMVLGEERGRLLAEARRLAREAGKKLGVMFDNTEKAGLAQMVRFETTDDDHAAGLTRYLALWPALQTGTKDHRKWRELVVMLLVEDADGVRLDTSAPFRSKTSLRVVQPTADQAADAALASDLGDALNCLAIAMRDWAETTRLSGLLPPSAPGRS